MPTPLKNKLPPLNLKEEPIGKRLALVRKRRGLTQKELANKIGITQAMISDYEVGRTHLSDEMIIRFCLILKTSADYILGLNNEGISEPISRSLVQKMSKIENLSANDKRALLKNIDMFLEGAKARQQDK